ncbi:hypothetical protein K491DRAFT_619966 [Lophiostoma macrostomum CBS 122681]|uniref:Histone transcription regulator 3 homolog n=1 Tax=Lophiostoma macrostomum CBS 122681 TaxID=1314788 RepID=A0A6A6TMH1_9PLEO|nr:hypothetical protein K491DRAFT_619966 [Lophiostoma macrostomum CBS 122681]
MSAFKALNVDSDHESEDEIDDTKEIQIEEALKLYQTALKYHSEGPASFDKAAEAYKALFDSEIFKYNESLSEYKRHELFGENLVFDTILEDEFDAGPVQLTSANDSAPNTLPQILHLSYKNHGQFMLETMQHWHREHGTVAQQQRSPPVLGALQCFAEALDKEDTDLDLWLRTASVAALLGSRRITRFCLEAVLDGDDEMLDGILRLPGLEEGFAGQQLRELVAKLEDNLSLMQAPLSSMNQKKLSEKLKRRLNPYPFAPLPSEAARPDSSIVNAAQPERLVLNPSKWDWAGVGEVILHHFHAEQGGFIDPPPGSGISINIPASVGADPSRKPSLALVADNIPVAIEEDESPALREESALPTTGEHATSANGNQDVVMEEPDKDLDLKNEEKGLATPVELTVPQSRKRSTDSAGLPETAEGGRSRSKRIRARDITDGSVAAESAGPDPAKQLEDKLYSYTHADKCLFEIVNDMLERLGVDGLGSPQELRELLTANPSGSVSHESMSIDQAGSDLYAALQSGATKVAMVFLSGEAVDLGGMSREAGLNAFLGYAKSTISQSCVKPVLGCERLRKFASDINTEWLSIKEVAFLWLESLLSPGLLPCPADTSQASKSSYMQYRWTEDLKRHLVQIIVNFDDFIYERLLDRITTVDHALLNARAEHKKFISSEWNSAHFEMIEIIFELHLDIYSLIKHPSSGVDANTQIAQKDRLDRWSALARDAMQLRTECDPDIGIDQLALRHIWASVFQLSVSDDIQPEHVIYGMEELKMIFESIGRPVIEVQNNAVMPELSIAAIDRELARIGMKDFFLRVFDQDERDPVATIESLEPLLEPIQDEHPGIEPVSSVIDDDQSDSRSSTTIADTGDLTMEVQSKRPTPSQEMRKFLDTASVSLRLSLWQRLREAYEAIEYPPKVLSCYLRSIETLVAEFKNPIYRETSAPERYVSVLSRLRIVDEILVKTLHIVRCEKTAFDCLPYEHLQTSMTAVTELLRVMSAGNMLEDLVRVQHIPMPRFEGCAANIFITIQARLHDMQLRAWMLQYYLLKEGIAQNASSFPTPSEEQFELLRHVHYATGVRGFCHSAGRTFLRLAKDEILRLDDVIDGNNRDTELAQVLNDLYGLKTFVQAADCLDFASIPEVLDKRTATQLLSFILTQARKVSIKDLPKTDVKVTIDKVHGALGRPKSNDDISLNRKILTSYFKSPINPIALFNCLKGIGSLSTKNISAHVAVAASKGWYFLMGNIALNKFRSQKRLTQGPTEDLNFAQAFFLQDLEYSVERWETWYRLAQANDTQLEECVSWNADKMNNNNSLDLIHFQRAAIRCYIMAVASAVRDADAAPQTIAKVSDMYTDFGNRVYASSREPFSMSAFTLRDTEQKYYSGSVSQQVYQNAPFYPLSVYTAIKLASVLFKRATVGKPERWWNYYMLGKCLWKMYCWNCDAAVFAAQRGEAYQGPKGPGWEEVVDALANAIDTLPEKRERGREPVLEPHYKLVSIAHKLWQRKAVDHQAGAQILRHTSYAQNVSGPENADDWERYVLAVLKALRAADKSSWHHRIIARAAHVIFDDSNDTMVAYGAKHELTQQMFTKTMAVQVWKPEHERPGRHFVYTSRYTRFFIQLLDLTGDQSNLEALARRVRRKQSDFFEHSKLWQDLCLQYLRFLRRIGRIPEGNEDAVFKSINHDEFTILANRLETWCTDPNSQHQVLSVLRDTNELKKLNSGLMKPLLIDDLVGDTFAVLYQTVAPTLPPLPSEQSLQPQSAQPNFNPIGHPNPTLVPISSLTQVQVDGSSESAPNPNLPFSIYHPNQLQGPIPTLADNTSRPRAKAIGRREIQRRAEAASVKPVAPLSAPTNMPIRSPTLSRPPVLLPARESPEKIPLREVSPSKSNEQPRPRSNEPQAFASHITSVENSAPASVQDDADDESELSELDESVVREIRQGADVKDPPPTGVTPIRPMFPNLMANQDKREATESVLNGVENSAVEEDR